MDFVGGVDFVGGRFTEVGAGKLRTRVKSTLKKVARHALVPPGIPLPKRKHGRTRTGDEYDPETMYNQLGLVAGVDFVGHRLTEVGAGKLRTKVKTALKKVGKTVGKVAQAVVKTAAKIVPPPYNVAFNVAAKIGDKAASAVQKARAQKAVQGLGELAKRGDTKARATLGTLKLAADAAKGRNAPAAVQFLATARANAAVRPSAPRAAQAMPRTAAPRAAPARAAPAPARRALPADAVKSSPRGAYQVISPSGKRFTIEL